MFKELLDNPDRIEAGELQSLAARRFPSVVKDSHLSLREAGAPISSNKTIAIIGVATYSLLELRLLDMINDAHPQWGDSREVAVFDLATCENLAIAVEYFSRPVSSSASPMLVIYKDGDVPVYMKFKAP